MLLWGSVCVCFKLIGDKLFCGLVVGVVINGFVGVGWLKFWILRIIVIVIEVVIVNCLDCLVKGIMLLSIGIECYWDVLGVIIVGLVFSVVVIEEVIFKFGVICIFLCIMFFIIW